MSDLMERLRGVYTVGPIVDGEPEFGRRNFEGFTPPIQIEAADTIAQQATRIEELEAALTKLAYLGNGNVLGNSEGNRIAQESLKPQEPDTPRDGFIDKEEWG